jgi:four helix bundle protein
MKYDLEDRCSKFGEDVIMFLKTVPKNEITRPLVNQLVRSATSIGANYIEGNETNTKRDFRNKVNIAKKEAGETKHWLRMIGTSEPSCKEKCRELWQEANELTLILASILQKTDSQNK